MCHCHSHSCCSKGGCGCGCHSSHNSCCGSSCGGQKSSVCGCSGCSCSSQGSGGGCGCGNKQGDCNYASKFLELADCAWMEVLKEKIKEHIQSNAQHMDELARMISEANRERWQKKMENKQCCGNFEEKINEFFGQSCPSKAHQGNQQGNQNKQR